MIRRLRSVLDWRLVASICGLALVVLLAWATLDAARGRDQAFETLQDSRAVISRRIDLLNDTIGVQAAAIASAEATIAGLRADVEALQRQLVGLGVDPVVDPVPPDPAPSRPPDAPSQPAPPPAPDPPPPPEPQPPPPPPPQQPNPAPQPEPEPEPPLQPVCDLLLGLC